MLNRRTIISSFFAAPFLSLFPFKGGICGEENMLDTMDITFTYEDLIYKIKFVKHDNNPDVNQRYINNLPVQDSVYYTAYVCENKIYDLCYLLWLGKHVEKSQCTRIKISDVDDGYWAQFLSKRTTHTNLLEYTIYDHKSFTNQLKQKTKLENTNG